MSEVIDRQEQAARQSWTEIVVDFGIDRFQRSLTKYGTFALLVLGIALSYYYPQISCFPQADFKNTKIPSEFKQFNDVYCWELDVEDIKVGNPEEHHDFNEYDPRILMESLINCLLLQLVILQLPFLYWDGTTGGVILGHIKYLKNLIEDIATTFKRLDMVPDHDDIYDETGEIIRPSIGACFGESKRSENTNAGQSLLATPNVPSAEQKNLTDLSFMNLLLLQNIASMEQYPYVRSIIKIYKSSNFQPTKEQRAQFESRGFSGSAKPKHHQLEHLMRMWWNNENLTSKHLAWQYIVKHILEIVFAVTSVLLMIFKGNFRFIIELENNKFICDLPEYDNLKASCFILGHKEIAMLAMVNFIILLIVILTSITSIIMLCHSRLSNQADGGLTGFMNQVQYSGREGWEGYGAEIGIFKEILVHEKEKAAENPQIMSVQLEDLRRRKTSQKTSVSNSKSDENVQHVAQEPTSFQTTAFQKNQTGIYKPEHQNKDLNEL